MRIAIMQPYFLPYIGYFQLIKAVDKFVFYDDVNYIKQGWINRNNIVLQGQASLFTIPLEKASSFSKINEVPLHPSLYPSWKVKFKRSIEQNYKKAPHFEAVFLLLNRILDTEVSSIGSLAKRSVVLVSEYLGLRTVFEDSSTVYNNQELSGKHRVLSICKAEGAKEYINPIGGQELYDKKEFEQHQLKLFFIQTTKSEYTQFEETFIPWLSILDVLMFNSIAEVNTMLDAYELI